jgi:hypothetical protein
MCGATPRAVTTGSGVYNQMYGGAAELDFCQFSSVIEFCRSPVVDFRWEVCHRARLFSVPRKSRRVDLQINRFMGSPEFPLAKIKDGLKRIEARKVNPKKESEAQNPFAPPPRIPYSGRDPRRPSRQRLRAEICEPIQFFVSTDFAPSGC